MNERDSEELLGILMAQGYEVAQWPKEADVILLNTCSVRQHAEERAFGKMGELSILKRERPELVLGIIGCTAKLYQDRIFKRLPGVDLVAGPAELYDLPYLLAKIQEKRQREVRGSEFIVHTKSSQLRITNHERRTKVTAVAREFRPLDHKPAGEYRRPGVRAFVTIMEGCDKRCSYCVVPQTRGQEISRPAEEIISEIAGLVELGYRDITLLGQNVNSYGKWFPDGSGYRGPLGRLRLLENDPERLLDFPQLLRMIDDSLQNGDSPHSGTVPIRIRFTTSHPLDANERLFEAVRECVSVCESMHLPVQSGSNRILRAMRRGYTAEAYLRKIDRLRQLVPGISLSTDVIVGYPGETEADFEATVRMMREVEFDSAFIFKYSPRPGTVSAGREDDVPYSVKQERNQILLGLQGEIDSIKHRGLKGRYVEILVEERGRFAGQWFGRMRGNQGVVVESEQDLLGRFLTVRIARSTKRTLFGEHALEPIRSR